MDGVAGTDDARSAPSKIATMTERRPYAGARNSPRSQPTVSLDFIGSISSTTRWWMWPQAGHSKVRTSKPEESGVMRASYNDLFSTSGLVLFDQNRTRMAGVVIISI
jgi:hypothetical protein